jgi:hypothetical protein
VEVKINILIESIDDLVCFFLGNAFIDESFKILKSLFGIPDFCFEFSDFNNDWWIIKTQEIFLSIVFKSILLELDEFFLLFFKTKDSFVDFINQDLEALLHFS